MSHCSRNPSVPATGDPVSVAGWGVLEEDGQQLPRQLREITIPVVDNNTCAQV